MPTAFTILIILTVLIAILTFVIPAGEYQYQDGIPIAGTYQEVASNPQGIWDVIAAPIEGFASAIGIAMFVIVLGGTLGIIFETRAIDAGLSKIVERLQGREKLMIPALMAITAIGGTTYGMAEETIAFYPIVIPILLAAGYDVVTGIMVIFLGAGIGVTGGIINPFSVGIGSSLADISLGDGIFIRILLFLLYLAFGIWFVMNYAEKVKRDPSQSIVADMKETVEQPFLHGTENKTANLTKKRRNVLIVFGLMFLLMIVSIIPSSDKFGIEVFNNFHNALMSVPIVGPIIGNTLPLGEWYFKEMTMIFLIGGIIIGKIYGMKEEQIVALFIDGAKDILSVALIIGVAKGISVIMIDGQIIDTILHYGENVLSNLPAALLPAVSYLLYIPMSFLIPSSSGLATATIPILAPLTDFVGVGREFIVMASQAGSQTMNFMSPTQAVLMGALALANIPYGRWLKHIVPFVLGVVIITVVVLTLGTMI